MTAPHPLAGWREWRRGLTVPGVPTGEAAGGNAEIRGKPPLFPVFPVFPSQGADTGTQDDGQHDAAERAALAAHYAEPATAVPYAPGDPDPLRDGLLAGAAMRPPSWVGDTPPPPGAWCSCCCRHAPQEGGRWWTERESPRGWRCCTCYPPSHLRADAVREVRT